MNEYKSLQSSSERLSFENLPTSNMRRIKSITMKLTGVAIEAHMDDPQNFSGQLIVRGDPEQVKKAVHMLCEHTSIKKAS